MSKSNLTVIQRLLDKIEVNCATHCWNWTGNNYLGYGRMRVSTTKHSHTHRVSYEYFRGKIPNGLHIDHLCRNPSCCNPDHLEPVPPRENMRRGFCGILRTHCKRGHKWIPENMYISRAGVEQCAICMKMLRDAYVRPADLPLPTHCKYGHQLTPENTWINPKSRLPYCKTCNREHQRERNSRLRK